MHINPTFGIIAFGSVLMAGLCFVAYHAFQALNADDNRKARKKAKKKAKKEKKRLKALAAT